MWRPSVTAAGHHRTDTDMSDEDVAAGTMTVTATTTPATSTTNPHRRPAITDDTSEAIDAGITVGTVMTTGTREERTATEPSMVGSGQSIRTITRTMPVETVM